MDQELTLNGVTYSTDKKRLDVGYVHAFLSTSYWAKEIPITTVLQSIEHSLCVGIYEDGNQIGFARVISDYATFAYLADVFVDEQFRKKGISKELMRFILALDFIPGLRRIMLATWDAHGLYQQFGFRSLKSPDRYMEITIDNMYATKL